MSGILGPDIVSAMATKDNQQEIAQLRERARAEIKAWVDSHGRGFQNALAKRLGYRPSHVSKVLKPDSGAEGSPEFVQRLAEEYPEWRALWLDFKKLESPQLYGGADAFDALESAAARAKDLQLLTELETQIKQAVSRISEIARKHVE